jgi:hypothetical protein
MSTGKKSLLAIRINPTGQVRGERLVDIRFG